MALPIQKLAKALLGAETGLRILRSLQSHDPRRNGGYLVILNANTGIVEATLFIGECSAPDALRYLMFAMEKATRLYKNPQHDSSFQSRDASRNMYQGAIRAGNYIFSFSGLDEEEDEATSLMSAIWAGCIGRRKAKGMVSVWANTKFTTCLALSS